MVIKTKINYPFIYILMDPTIVFVYKIETQNYITVLDLSRTEAWGTFELEQEVEFETFDHRKNKSTQGRTFFANQDDMVLLVEFINQQIQKNRQLRTNGPVHIVSSESTAGSLKSGLLRPKTVIGFPDFLSIGPLGKLDEKMAQTYRKDWLIDNINFEQETEYPIKFSNTLREIEDIPSEVPIYIWYGNNANEQVCMRFLIHLLKDKTNKLFLINSTDLYEKHISTQKQPLHIFNTSQIESQDIKMLFEKNNKDTPLSDKERNHLQLEWEALAKTKEVLRIWRNGEIKGVPEDHVDSPILQMIENLQKQQGNNVFIKIGEVLGELIVQLEEFVDIFYLEYRIRHLIYSGFLEIKGIPKSLWNYSIRMRNE
ncbi:DUF1835 domain-containing protein [Psychrobacillus sp. NPDC093180]|uniref:DUF1835 domain-containing protein n=1 Tax=Psychrobacillus sp. NPDC093180 TaxID=3364489 RepID=UPI00380ACBFA